MLIQRRGCNQNKGSRTHISRVGQDGHEYRFYDLEEETFAGEVSSDVRSDHSWADDIEDW